MFIKQIILHFIFDVYNYALISYEGRLQLEKTQLILLLKSLFNFLHATYVELGFEEMRNLTDPSIDDLLELLSDYDKHIPVSNINAKQSIILADGLLKDLKCSAIDDMNFKNRLQSILNTDILKDDTEER